MNSYHPPEDRGTKILFEDPYLLVVSKPSGLLSVPGRGAEKSDCLISRINKSHPSALIVHRLDMATSGLMILALNADIHKALSISFQNREVSKEYQAIISGVPATQAGVIDYPLIADWPNRPLQKIDVEHGKPSVTHWSILDQLPDASRVRLTPETGRTHQLRVHMQSFGHPILGDVLYASEAQQKRASRLLLHATKLKFMHPISDEKLRFTEQPDF